MRAVVKTAPLYLALLSILYGLCVGRCEPGFEGPACRTPCSAGTYGNYCAERCGHCSDGLYICDRSSGHCPEKKPRCMPGYSGLKCDTVCTRGTYGPDCRERCGNCVVGPSNCDSISGHCPPGVVFRCISGFSGPKCATVCAPGTYGLDCEGRCVHCAGNPTGCDTISGECPEKTPRCQPGYSGLKCDAECLPGKYGLDCNDTCGFCAQGRTVCSHTFGHCPKREPRCMEGYYGSKCALDSTSASSLRDVIIGSVAVGCAILIIVLVVVVVVVRFRRKKKTTQTTPSARKRMDTPERPIPTVLYDSAELYGDHIHFVGCGPSTRYGEGYRYQANRETDGTVSYA